MPKKRRNYDEPLRHPDHPKPITRRELVAQGFMAGAATALTGGALSLFANPRDAFAALSNDLADPVLQNACGISPGAGKIPFICFDLAGGANIAGSNVLVGKEGGQLDFLSTPGYSTLGLPGDMVPGAIDPNTNLDHIDQGMGLAFHSDSPFQRGMRLSIRTPGIEANINGAVIPARSENDTGNNPHNPLYGIQLAGADGEILSLIGSENSDSGGNSMAPAMMVNPEFRPTKIDRPSDVTGLVDTGQLVGILGPGRRHCRHGVDLPAERRQDGQRLDEPDQRCHRQGPRQVRLPEGGRRRGSFRRRAAGSLARPVDRGWPERTVHVRRRRPEQRCATAKSSARLRLS